MANEKVISPEALIAQFEVALANDYGYIYGASGAKWTQAGQDQKVNYMKNLYGDNWKNSASAKENKYYYSALYGAKWIGHYVLDCSGFFVWAYKKFGVSIAHGSNSIYKSYCSAKGTLKNGKRTDGKPLLPGTAVFTGTESAHGHIGLYIGNGYVIEAKGTQAGVVKSSVTEARWTYWGELSAVNYTGIPQPEPEPAPAPAPAAGTAIVTGKNLALREGPSTSAKVILRIPTGKTVRLESLPGDWDYVSYNGKNGFVMKQFIQKG